jgi:hypothetical protein
MTSDPERLPVAVGVKKTEMVQLVREYTTSPHVFVSEKSPVVPIPGLLSR